MNPANARLGVLVAAMFWTAGATAQEALPARAETGESAPGGFRVRNVSAYSTWYSSAVPSGTPAFGSALHRLGSDVATGGAFLISGRRTRPVAETWFSYSGSYQAMMRYAEWRAYSQFLSAGFSWHVKPRWTLTLTAAGVDTTAMESLLNPGTAAAFRATPVSMEELAAAASAGNGADPRIAAYLTGSPFINSGTQLLLFGRRLLSASMNSMLTWNKSSRLSFYFGGVSAAAQHVSRRQGDITDVYPQPRSIGANAGLGFSYQLTPRTEIGLNGTVARTHSRTEDAYITSATMSAGRRMSRQWFVHADVGTGTYHPVTGSVHVSRAPRVIGRATIGYQKRSHTLTAMYGRTLSDAYGFGIGRQSSATGSWVWQRPGWSFFATAGQQQVESLGLAALRGWTVSGGASKFLTSHLSLQIQQAYLRTSGSYLGLPGAFDLLSIRVSLNWTPEISMRTPTRRP